MTRISILIAILGVTGLTVAQSSDNSGEAAFARMRTLAGDWEGRFKWTGARKDSGSMNATYYLTGNNSAVVENLIMGGMPSMTSVYHMNGGELRMTHYCGAGNQPRLKAERIDADKGDIDFSFVDATNLRSPDAPHVHGLELRFLDDEHITLTFLFQSGQKESRELITLARARGSQAIQRPSSTSTPVEQTKH